MRCVPFGTFRVLFGFGFFLWGCYLFAEKPRMFRLSKNAQVQGARNARSEAYLQVRRSDEDEGNAADGRFSSASHTTGTGGGGSSFQISRL